MQNIEAAITSVTECFVKCVEKATGDYLEGKPVNIDALNAINDSVRAAHHLATIQKEWRSSDAK